MYYFAYGSNLSHKQMRERCPGARFVCLATLRNYRLQFDGHSARWQSSVANIVPAVEEAVLGGLYRVTDKDIRSLDEYEGVGARYERHTIEVDTPYGIVKAETYSRPAQVISKPSPLYMARLKQGMIDCGIVQQLQHASND